jgi:methionyl-tRNA synthetase
MSNYKRTLITSALPYANGPVHIGHLAGVYVFLPIFMPVTSDEGRRSCFYWRKRRTWCAHYFES